MTTAVSKFAEVRSTDGSAVRIHYTVHGEGPDVLLLHGAGPGANGRETFSRNLDELGGRHRCWVIDIPGWGRSSKNLAAFGSPNPMKNAGSAALAFMESVGLRNAHVVGVTMGGSAGLYLALEAPERVNRLVIADPGGGHIPEATGPTPAVAQLLTYYLGNGPSLAKMEAFLRLLVYNPAQVTPELVRQRYEASLDPEVIANPPLRPPPPGSASRPGLGQDPRLAQLEHQVLVLWGLEDQCNPWQGMQSFRALPRADFVLLSRCGHWVQWERPDRFNVLVLDFLAQL